MARDWDPASTMALLEARLEKVAPNNTAPIPISVHKERHEVYPDRWVWVANVMVRIPRVTEYDVEGFGDTAGDALRRVYLGLNNEARTRRQANVANAQFGVQV